MESVTFVVEEVEYYNDTGMTQVFYDAEGNPVYVLPGEKKKYTKRRRALPQEVILVKKEEDVINKGDVKGQSKTDSRKSEKGETRRTARHFNRR